MIYIGERETERGEEGGARERGVYYIIVGEARAKKYGGIRVVYLLFATKNYCTRQEIYTKYTKER